MATRTGRPPTYRDEFAQQAGKLCALGATDMELADFFGVTARTIARWRVDHDAFCQAVKTAKEPADDRVERRLYERAMGYSVDEEVIHVVNGKIRRTVVRKHYPPDTAAAFIWLKNRRGWRDRFAIEQSGPDGGPIQYQQIEMRIVRPSADTAG